MILRDTRMIPVSPEMLYKRYNLNKTGTKSLEKTLYN